MLQFAVNVCLAINAVVVCIMIAISMIMIKDLNDERPYDIFYLCDRKACGPSCGHACKHTKEIKHAMNFRRRIGGYYEKEG